MKPPERYRILVCRGPECGAQRGSVDLHLELRRLLHAYGLERRVELGWQSCFGRCQSGPNILVSVAQASATELRFSVLLPNTLGDGVLYNAVRADELGRLLQEHIVGGRPIRAMMNRRPPGGRTP